MLLVRTSITISNIGAGSEPGQQTADQQLVPAVVSPFLKGLA